MTKEIKAVFTADEKGFTKGAAKAEQSASSFEKALGKLGPVGKSIQGVIDKLGLSSISSAVGIATVPAALTAGYAIAQKSVDTYVELGTKIRDYSILTGQSAEVSSRQVQAFEELGVSEETAGTSMLKLSKAIETAPKKLEELGIVIAKDARGNVDLGQTLLNVAAAWQGTTDAAKRNEIALAAFGKGGAAMIPILEANAAELANLEKRIQTVYTAEDLQRVRDYKLAQQENQRAAEDFWNSLGAKLLPAWLANTQAMNENIYVNEHLDEQLKKMGASQSQNRVAIMEADKALRAEYQSSLDARKAADSLATSQQAAADAATAEANAENALYDSIHKSIDASFAYTQAQLDLRAAQQKVKETAGKNAEANLQLQEAYVKMADAAVALAEAQAEANGTTLSAAEKADIFRSRLQALANELAPNSPLRKYLEGLIADYDRIPKDITTTIHTRHVDSSGSTKTVGGTKSYDSGGVVPGPEGSAQAAIVHGGEMVLTPDQQKALGTNGNGGRGGDTHIHVHVDRGAFIDGPGLDRLATEILRRARFAPGT